MIIVPAVSDPIRTARQAAERARCLAYGLLATGDRLRLLQHAQELERQAVALELEAACGDSSTPPVTPSGPT
jgi:hypothetical protein